MHASFLAEMPSMSPAGHLAALARRRHYRPVVEQTRHSTAFAGELRRLTATTSMEGGRHLASKMAHLRHLARSEARWVSVATNRCYRLMAVGKPSRRDWRDLDAQQNRSLALQHQMEELPATPVACILPRDASRVR